MSTFTLRNIDTSYDCYLQMISLYHENKDNFLDEIQLSFEQWFGANMCSALGGVLDKLVDGFNTIKLGTIPQSIKTIIQKNDFLSYYGHDRIHDTHNTTIKYLKLKPTDGRYFHGYVVNELLLRPELPSMSTALKKKITESIYEIFVNAQIHSETNFIYTCGQFYPGRHKIEFTITDTGMGFKNKINKRFGTALSSTQAIKWAVTDGHSTKVGVSGGIGLALLKEFIQKNNGKIQIVSDDGFYQFNSAGEQIQRFPWPFPGTIVNVQFRTDDTASYILKSEQTTEDLF
jgi:hypothetical protein